MYRHNLVARTSRVTDAFHTWRTRLVLGFCNFLVKISTLISLLYCAGISDYPRTL